MNEQMLRDDQACKHACGLKCMSWSGVLAGALIAVGLSFILSIFCAGLGLAAFTTSPEGVTTIAVGGYIGMVIGVIAIMYFAGWVAGYVGGRSRYCFNRNVGALYGITAWCLALVITIMIAAQSMQFVTTNLYTITGNNLSTARMFNETVTLMVSEQPTSENRKVVMTNVSEREAELLSRALFLTFGLFFIGAISSALGGYCGLKPCDRNCRTCCSSTDK